MIEEKLKKLAKLPDLELLQELPEMFRLSWEGLDPNHVQDVMAIITRLNLIPINLGSLGGIYNRFLDKVDQLTLPEIPEKDRLEYLYDLNKSMGYILKGLVDITLLSKLNNQDIHNGFVKICRDYNIESLVSTQQLDTVTSFARFVNIQQQVYNNPDVNLRPIVQYEAQAAFDLPANELFLQAGKIVNQSFLLVFHRHIFNIVICISEVHRSLLLNEIKLDNQIYSEKVLQLWVNVFAMLDGMGHNWNSIQRIYAVIMYNDESK